MDSALYEWVRGHLVKEFGISPAQIHPGATFLELDLDSLSLAELAVIAEEATGTQLVDVDRDSTVEQVVQKLGHITPEILAGKP